MTKINYEDINNFLPDNKTIGNSEYYQKKYPGLPSYVYDILEVKSRIEYKDNTDALISIIKEKHKEDNNKLIQEWEEKNNKKDDAEELELKMEEIDINNFCKNITKI